MKRQAAILCLLAVGLGLCSAQDMVVGNGPTSQSGQDTILQVNLRILGGDVLPFSSGKQNAVISGVASVLNNKVSVSDISLTVLKQYDNVTAYGSRRLLQQPPTFPAVDTQLRIRTSASEADSQADTISQATNVTYGLVSAVGAQGLQLQQFVFQSSEIQSGQSIPPLPSGAPPPSLSPPSASPPSPRNSVPPVLAQFTPVPSESTGIPAVAPLPSRTQQPEQAAASPPETAPTPPPLNSGVGTFNAAASNSEHSSLSGGAIAGIAVGGVAILAILAVLVVFVMRRQAAANTRRRLAFGSAKPGALEGTSSNIVAYSSSFGQGNSSGERAAMSPDDIQEHGMATEKIEVR